LRAAQVPGGPTLDDRGREERFGLITAALTVRRPWAGP
jgi:hypothetical protein